MPTWKPGPLGLFTTETRVSSPSAAPLPCVVSSQTFIFATLVIPVSPLRAMESSAVLSLSCVCLLMCSLLHVLESNSLSSMRKCLFLPLADCYPLSVASLDKLKFSRFMRMILSIFFFTVCAFCLVKVNLVKREATKPCSSVI